MICDVALQRFPLTVSLAVSSKPLMFWDPVYTPLIEVSSFFVLAGWFVDLLSVLIVVQGALELEESPPHPVIASDKINAIRTRGVNLFFISLVLI